MQLFATPRRRRRRLLKAHFRTYLLPRQLGLMAEALLDVIQQGLGLVRAQILGAGDPFVIGIGDVNVRSPMRGIKAPMTSLVFSVGVQMAHE